LRKIFWLTIDGRDYTLPWIPVRCHWQCGGRVITRWSGHHTRVAPRVLSGATLRRNSRIL